jgi:hypothetical protein
VLVDQHGLGLRAGDTLYLAIASEHGTTVHTLASSLRKPPFAQDAYAVADVKSYPSGWPHVSCGREVLCIAK